MSLGDDVHEALLLCDQMRRDGTPETLIANTLETLLRDKWPNVRVWHYLCDNCRDTGMEVMACPSRPCDRRQAHGPHEYVRPCWCAAGERWKGKPRTEATAVETAAKTSKPRAFTRAGR